MTRFAPPPLDGVGASRVQLRPGDGATYLDALCARFPRVGRDAWRSRFSRGRVLGARGDVLSGEAMLSAGGDVFYYREVVDEPVCAGVETLVHVDDDLAVVDKPHGLVVMPAGRHASDTLLARLTRRLGIDGIAPLHRIDRETAGLVMFSLRPQTRDAYLALFRDREIRKRYEALAPAMPGRTFPLERLSRIERAAAFPAMREVNGEANSRSRVDVIER